MPVGWPHGDLERRDLEGDRGRSSRRGENLLGGERARGNPPPASLPPKQGLREGRRRLAGERLRGLPERLPLEGTQVSATYRDGDLFLKGDRVGRSTGR